MDLSQLQNDLKKENEGVWVPYPDSDIEFKIARIGTPDYEKFLRKLLKKSQFNNPGSMTGLLSREQLNIAAPALARYVLLDWKNITENGKEIPYSQEKALELLSDPRFENIATFVISVGNNANNYLVEYEKEVVKN